MNIKFFWLIVYKYIIYRYPQIWVRPRINWKQKAANCENDEYVGMTFVQNLCVHSSSTTAVRCSNNLHACIICPDDMASDLSDFESLAFESPLILHRVSHRWYQRRRKMWVNSTFFLKKAVRWIFSLVEWFTKRGGPPLPLLSNEMEHNLSLIHI